MNAKDLPPLRVGLLVDGLYVSKYTYELADWLQKSTSCEFACAIILRPPQILTRPNLDLNDFLSRKSFGLLEKIERLLLASDPQYSEHTEFYNLADLSPKVVMIEADASRTGVVWRYASDQCDEIRKTGCDVLIRCGSGILSGEILRVARYGIVSFHHGDNRRNRGGPAGFWEVNHKWPSTGFVIQTLSEELDGGKVHFRGAYPTKRRYLLNQAALYRASNAHLKRLLERLACERSLPDPEPALPCSAPLYTLPKISETIHYGLVVSGDMLKRRVKKFRHENWGVSYVFRDWQDAVLRKGVNIPCESDRFLADPFLFMRDGRTFCFVEEMVHSRGSAHISVFELTPNEAVRLGVALKEPFHLSFPFLFEFYGQLYMLPETLEAGQIRLYRCIQFPLRWELDRVLMDGVCAVDSMLFEYGRRWWMLTNIDSSCCAENCSELHVFYSDSPLATDWKSVSRNPVVFDPACARNGGLLTAGDKLFRVGQRQGFNRYGAAATIFEIKNLTTQYYTECKVAEIVPEFYPNLLGAHHMSSLGGVTVYDHLK